MQNLCVYYESELIVAGYLKQFLYSVRNRKNKKHYVIDETTHDRTSHMIILFYTSGQNVETCASMRNIIQDNDILEIYFQFYNITFIIHKNENGSSSLKLAFSLL